MEIGKQFDLFESQLGIEIIGKTIVRVGNFVLFFESVDKKGNHIRRPILIINRGGVEEKDIKYSLVGGTSKYTKSSEKLLHGIVNEDKLDYVNSGGSIISVEDNKKSKKQKDVKYQKDQELLHINDFSFKIYTKKGFDKLKEFIKTRLSIILETDPSRECIEEFSKEKIKGLQKTTFLTQQEVMTASYMGLFGIDYMRNEYTQEGRLKYRSYNERLYFGSTIPNISIFRKLRKKSTRISKKINAPLIYFPSMDEIKNGITHHGIRISDTAMRGFQKCIDDEIPLFIGSIGKDDGYDVKGGKIKRKSQKDGNGKAKKRGSRVKVKVGVNA